MRAAQSSTTSANASLPAARSSTGSRRHAGSTRKKVYATYWPSTLTMLALVGVRDEDPTERLVGHGRLAALVRAGADRVHRRPDQREVRLGRPVGVVHARLPAVVVGLVGDVEDEEAAHRRLAGRDLQRLVVVRRLHPFGDRFRRRRLGTAVEAPLRDRNLRVDAVLVVEDRQLRALLRG